RRSRRCALKQRLRYATQAEVACDRFLLAHLSRLQPRHLLAELMKDLRGPTITPGLNHTATFPNLRIGEEKTGRIGQLGVLMGKNRPFTPIALQPHHLRKGQILLGITVAPPSLSRAEPLRVPVPECRRHRIPPPPLPLPLDMP